MRRVRRLVALGGRREIHQHPALFDPDRIGRHTVVLEARLADPGDAVELPLVPRADDIVPVEPPLTQWPTHMVARVRDRTELAGCV